VGSCIIDENYKTIFRSNHFFYYIWGISSMLDFFEDIFIGNAE